MAPTIAQLKQYSDAAINTMSAAEKLVKADIDALKSANPKATEEELGHLYEGQVLQSSEAAAHFAAHVRAQTAAHAYEALIIARSSGVSSSSDAAMIQDSTDRYVAKSTSNLLPLRTRQNFSRLLGVIAASADASTTGHDLTASALAEIGFDRPAADPVATAASTLSKSSVAAIALGVEGALIGDHLMTDEIRNSDFRKEIIAQGGDASREITRSLGVGNNAIVLKHYVQRQVAHTVPPPPVPADARGQESWTDSFVRKAQDTATRVEDIIIHAAPEVRNALPGGSDSGK